MIIALFFISLIGGFLSGLLGLGGAVIMIPLMLTVPPLLGLDRLTMKTVAGLSMVQVLASSISGIIIHKKNDFVHMGILLRIGIAMGICSLIGSFVSKFMNNRMVTIIFGVLVIVAFLLLIFHRSKPNEATPSTADLKPNTIGCVIAGSCVGLLAGIVGAGGGFVLLPIMIVLLRIPVKVSVGTSIGIVFIGALLGAFGKIASGQVDFLLIWPVIIGSLLAAQIGARVSKRMPPKLIKYALIVIVVISGTQVWMKILRPPANTPASAAPKNEAPSDPPRTQPEAAPATSDTETDKS